MNVLLFRNKIRQTDNERLYKGAARLGKVCYSVFRFALLFGVGFIILYPLLYMLSMAFRPYEQVYDTTVLWVPKSYTLDNVAYAIESIDFWESGAKTLALTLLSTILQCVSCSLVGYGFAKFNFRGKNIFFALVLFTLMIPPQTVTMPLFLDYSHFNFFGLGEIGRLFGGETWEVSLINTIWPNVIATISCQGLRAGLFIYMYRSYYSGLPTELGEAAYIDGMGFFGTYLRVMWPNAGPITLVTFLLTFVWYWNDCIYSTLLLSDYKLLSIMITNLSAYLDGAMPASDPRRILTLQSACLLYIIPVLVLYIVLQRKFTESIVKSGIVG